MTQSIVELISRQRQRIDALARASGRFLDEPSQAAYRRLSDRICKLIAKLAAPATKAAFGRESMEGHLERLMKQISLLRLDDPAAIARVAWVLAEIEEAFSSPTAGGGVDAGVYGKLNQRMLRHRNTRLFYNHSPSTNRIIPA